MKYTYELLVQMVCITGTPLLSGAPSSPLVCRGVRLTQFIVLCVCFVDRCLSFCDISVDHCVICYLRFTDSDYLFGIFKPSLILYLKEY